MRPICANIYGVYNIDTPIYVFAIVVMFDITALINNIFFAFYSYF